MSTPATPNPIAADIAPLSEAQRVVNTFIAPSKTFADIRRSSSWLVPWLLLSIGSLIFVFTIDKKIGFDQIVTNMMENMSEKQKERLEKATPEQRQAQERGMRIGVRYTSYASPIFLLLIGAVMAGLLMATFNFGFGGNITFGKSLAIVWYGWLPSLVKTVIGLAVVLAGMNPENFNLENPVATNLGVLVSQGEAPALFRFLSSLDAVNIWCAMLMGMGFAIVGGKKISTGVAMVLGWYVAVTLIRVGFAAMF
jgi:hypothetical protein